MSFKLGVVAVVVGPVMLEGCRTHTKPTDKPGAASSSAVVASSSASAGRSSPSAVASASPGEDPGRCVKNVIVGGQAICFEFNRDYYWCRGADYETRLNPKPGVPSQFPYLTIPVRYERLILGGSIGCGLDHSRKLWCWGATTRGQIPGERGYREEPTHMDYVPTPIDDFAVLGTDFCSRRGDEVWCFDLETKIVRVRGLGTPIRHIGVGVGFACAGNEEKVWCWGCYPWSLPEPLGNRHQNRCGPYETRPPEAVPMELPKGLRVRSLHVGSVHGCILGEDAGVYCFGNAVYGGWGTGEHPDCYDAPCPPHNFRKAHFVKTLGRSVRELGVGGAYACALKQDGTVWCWGANQGHVVSERENLVKRSTGTVLVVEALPVQREELGSDNRRLMTGLGHVCVEKNDGALWCWGSNAAKQFEVSATRHFTPREIELPSPRCPTP